MDLFALPNFTIILMESIISGVSFLFLFIAIARHYISPTPSKFWIKFVILALSLFLVYALLAFMIGDPLISIMQLEISPVSAGSGITESEFRVLSLYTYGVSSITNGLTALAIVYWLQKYLVHYLYHGYNLITKYRNFFEVEAQSGKTSILTYAFWLILLPFPIQQALSPNTIGISVVGTAFYLPAALALFVLWGLKLSGIIGITENKIFRLYNAVFGALLGFVVFQWLSVLIYSLASIDVLQEVIVRIAFLAIRSVFIFGPQALITAYFFKTILESRTQKNIIEYLKQKDKIKNAEIKVNAKLE